MKTKQVRISLPAHNALKKIAGDSSFATYLSALILYVETNDFNFKLETKLKEMKK
ncbi:MAG: hypothetical protein ACXAAH_05550 [Promethearchaeota archaeon]|jgi:hypothetical protein